MASRIIAVPLCPGLPRTQPWPQHRQGGHRSSGQGQHLTSPLTPRWKSLHFQHITSLSTRRLPCGLPSPSHGAQVR